MGILIRVVFVVDLVSVVLLLMLFVVVIVAAVVFGVGVYVVDVPPPNPLSSAVPGTEGPSLP